MREPRTGATGLRGLAVRMRRTSLTVRLTALGALVTAAVVFVAFLALSVEARASARRLFADELSRHQRTLLQLQRQNLTQLISSAAIITQSPTLRSALETYRLENNLGGAPRADLVRTVERELSNLVARVDRDLLLVTDDHGRVFAAAARRGLIPPRGEDLSGMAALRRAVDPTARAENGELAVYRQGTVAYQIAVYPLVLDGYTIGTLLLGDRLDDGMVASARRAFDGEIIVTAGRAILASTLIRSDSGIVTQLASVEQTRDSATTILYDGQELVAARLDLGQTQTGAAVSMWLMQPVGRAVTALMRPLARDFVIYGALAVLIAAVGSGLAAQSVLRSFRRFVEYMRSGATAERLEKRFDARDVPAEVRVLNRSFDYLMNSIEAKRSELEQRTTALTAANAVLMDEVQERKRMEHALHESEEQLRQSQKLEAVGTLAGGLAHDFNNLLTAMSGFTQLALMRADPKSSTASDLRNVVEAGDRAAHLIKQLLAFSRKQVLQPTVLDVAEVASGIVPLLGHLVGENITLTVEMDDTLARVIADRGQLEQVIINLAINARDAMPDGGTLKICAANAVENGRSAQARGGDRRIVLCVSDTGTGIPNAVRDRIFEPFFTTKEPGKGTGLGLSTVYGIVKQSGGTIDLETAVGVGTTFRITLPAASDVMIPGVVEPIVEDLPGGTETILLVEDDHDVRALTRRTLEERGYTVLPAHGAHDALHLAASARVDLLLTDIVMPQITGPRLVERFVAMYPTPVVIFMSGHADEALTSAGMKMGSAFLRKPFTPATLARTVREALDASKQKAHATSAT
jgi:signal transduction histidine kinase/ActR/RegA family two-component response regulator